MRVCVCVCVYFLSREEVCERCSCARAGVVDGLRAQSPATQPSPRASSPSRAMADGEEEEAPEFVEDVTQTTALASVMEGVRFIDKISVLFAFMDGSLSRFPAFPLNGSLSRSTR